MAFRAEQVKTYVRDLADRLGPGAVLPGERDLAESCGVSRMTVRRALDELEERRLIVRRQGAGTFVRHPAPAQPLQTISFDDDMRRRGLDPSAQPVRHRRGTADADLADLLECAPGEELLTGVRLRLADNTPMAIETRNLVASRLPDLTRDDLGVDPFYDMLRDRFGCTVSSGRQAVSPVVLSDEDADALETVRGAPALRFVRVLRDQHGEVIDVLDSLYRGDRYLVEMEVVPRRDQQRIAQTG